MLVLLARVYQERSSGGCPVTVPLGVVVIVFSRVPVPERVSHITSIQLPRHPNSRAFQQLERRKIIQLNGEADLWPKSSRDTGSSR